MPSTLTPPMSMVQLRPDLPGRSPSTAARSEMQLGTEATRGLRADTKRVTRTSNSTMWRRHLFGEAARFHLRQQSAARTILMSLTEQQTPNGIWEALTSAAENQ